MMDNCALFRELLAEYAADAASGIALDGRTALRRHLATCPGCRAELARLGQVEAALRAWPLAHLRHDLTIPVMDRVAQESRTLGWHWLPWRIWLPALVIGLVLGLALASSMTGQQLAPPQMLAASELPMVLPQAPPISALRQPLSASDSDLFWTIWCGLFVTLAGLGLGLGLNMDKGTLTEASEELRARWQHLREVAHF